MFQILQPAGWVKPSGYSNGIVASGRQVYIAGQVGWNERAEFDSDDFVAQVEQTLGNVVRVLAEAGGQPENIVRMTWFITNKKEYLDHLKEVGKCYRRIMGKNFPAMSMVQVGALIEDGAKVEIEATAVIPD